MHAIDIEPFKQVESANIPVSAVQLERSELYHANIPAVMRTVQSQKGASRRIAGTQYGMKGTKTHKDN
jgi:hypothetical protein